jgi:hypothetical protein
MRKRSLTLLFGLFALLAATAAGGVVDGQQRVIRVLSVTLDVDIDDKPPKGNSKGDMILATSQLRNARAQFGKARGRIVGQDRLRGVMESASVARVSVTSTLPGGTIKCQGKGYSSRTPMVLRVVFGTREFRGASGTCTASSPPPNSYGADALNVYRIRVPR